MIYLGFLGAGYWGPNLIRNFHYLAHSQKNSLAIYAIADLKEENLQKLQSLYPTTRFYTDPQKILTNPQIDAVVISTPPSTHYPLAKQALEEGKHVFVEKPLATSSKEVKQLLQLSQQKKRKLMVGHTFLYNDVVQEIHNLLQKKILGKLYYIYSRRVNLGRIREDVNCLWNLAPHDISVLNYWLSSPPLQVSAQGYTFLPKSSKNEDVAFLLLEYPASTIAHVHLSWLDPNKVREMVLVGSEKMLVYDDVPPDYKLKIADKKVELDTQSPITSFGDFQRKIRAGDVLLPKIPTNEPLYNEAKHFIECIQNNLTPRSNAQTALAVVTTLEAAQKSMEKKGEWQKIQLEHHPQWETKPTPHHQPKK